MSRSLFRGRDVTRKSVRSTIQLVLAPWLASARHITAELQTASALTSARDKLTRHAIRLSGCGNATGRTGSSTDQPKPGTRTKAKSPSKRQTSHETEKRVIEWIASRLPRIRKLGGAFQKTRRRRDDPRYSPLGTGPLDDQPIQ